MTPGSRSRAPWWGLAPILAVAFAIRLVWVLAVPVDPRESFLWDMTFYDFAALQVAEKAAPGSVILTMLPDTGERYLSSPLFEGIAEEMTDEERELSLSTPGYHMPPPE